MKEQITPSVGLDMKTIKQEIGWNFRLNDWTHSTHESEYPKSEGFYLTLCFTMGRYRYPRLVRLKRGKTGKLFAKEMDGSVVRRMGNVFFNCCWVRIISPNGEKIFDHGKTYSLGSEWK